MTPPTRREFIGLAGTATLAGLAGCGAQSAPTSTPEDPEPVEPEPATATAAPTPAATASPEPVEGAGAEVIEVAMLTDNQGSYFDPKGLLVEPGTTLRFVNEQGVHTATAFHPDNGGLPRRIPEAAVPFDSGIMSEPDETFEVTLEEPGVYDYVCVPHASLGMVGRLVVGEVDAGGPGTTEPSDLPPLARETMPSIESILAHGTVDGP